MDDFFASAVADTDEAVDRLDHTPCLPSTTRTMPSEHCLCRECPGEPPTPFDDWVSYAPVQPVAFSWCVRRAEIGATIERKPARVELAASSLTLAGDT
jgi:hypothetical protein